MTHQGKRLLQAITVALLGTISANSASANSAEVVLRIKERISMEELAASVSDPSSPRYQNYFSPDEIRELSAPSEEEYASLIQQLKTEGLEVVKESPTHLFVTVRGERSQLKALVKRAEQAFTALDFSPIARSIVSVNGLEPSQIRHHHAKLLPLTGKKAAFTGVTPAQIYKIYGFDILHNAGITGQGQHIAIATYNGFNISDVKSYYSKNALKPGPSVDAINVNGTATYDENSAMETETDAEFSGMIAPGASIHVFTSSQNSDAGELSMFTAILDDNRAKVVNYSWGSCESQVNASHKADMDKVFARAVAQGVNILVASGDSGSDCLGDGSVVADFPAANPNVVAVGGTSLSQTGNGANVVETAWSGSGKAGGSGGGISKLYALPSYQARLGGQFVRRSYPDLAFNADPNSGEPTYIHSNGKVGYMVIGGTSIAAPQWSGFLALVGQARGGKALGFLNPILYSIPASSMSKYLHDVSSGNNGAYNATVGYDAVTGLGSMHANSMLNYLKSI